MDEPGAAVPGTEQRVLQLTMTEAEVQILLAILRLGGAVADVFAAAKAAGDLAATPAGAAALAALCRRLDLLVRPDPEPGAPAPQPEEPS